MPNTPVTAEDEVRERVAYISPYEQWKKSEGLPTYRGLAIKNVNEVELAPWKSSGEGLAAFLNLEGTGGFNDSYIAEIPAGKSLKAHRHLFEETIYITLPDLDRSEPRIHPPDEISPSGWRVRGSSCWSTRPRH